MNIKKIDFVHGNVHDSDLLHRLFKQYRFTKVVHFAAESHVDRSLLDPSVFFHTNTLGTASLLNTVSHWKNTPEGFLLLNVSTDEVFGSLKNDEAPFNEDSPYRPNSPYAASKASADHAVRAWQKSFSFPAVTTYCSNNYGPWQFPEKLIPLCILHACEEKPIPVYGTGSQIRDWIHVEDHVDALLSVLKQPPLHPSYCIGASCERKNTDIVHLVADTVDRVLGRPLGFSRSLIEHVKDRPGHDTRYAIDSARIKEACGWVSRHRIEEDMESMVLWHLNHKNWLDRIRNTQYRSYYEKQYGKTA